MQLVVHITVQTQGGKGMNGACGSGKKGKEKIQKEAEKEVWDKRLRRKDEQDRGMRQKNKTKIAYVTARVMVPLTDIR